MTSYWLLKIQQVLYLSCISRMKYWSCCKRKTSDFNTFLSQEGCTKGTHLWRKKDAVGVPAWQQVICAGLHKGNSPVTPSSGVCWQRLKSWIWTFVLYENSLQGKKVVPCRFDWHQTGTQVIISIYAKNAVPELSYVDANSTTVSLSDRSSSYQNILSLDFFSFLLSNADFCFSPSARHTHYIWWREGIWAENQPLGSKSYLLLCY